MDLNELKKLLTDSHERFIVIEEGKPAYVLMGFEAYRTLKGQSLKDSQFGALSSVSPRPDRVDMVNAELEAERIRAKELAAKMAMSQTVPPIEKRSDASDYSRIRLEDLPL